MNLATGGYISEKRNVLICGPTSTGKSHLAPALGHEACRQGAHVLFINTNKMLGPLGRGRAEHSFERRLNGYLRADLLILDDFGLKPINPPGPEDLYDVINERCERARSS